VILLAFFCGQAGNRRKYVTRVADQKKKYMIREKSWGRISSFHTMIQQLPCHEDIQSERHHLKEVANQEVIT
jgi:hypothetical protein